jgi:LPS export ABC transporter permease LptF
LKTLHKYLLKQVLATLLMTVGVFTFVVMLFNVLKEILPLLVGGQVKLPLVLKALALLMPFAVVYALPMGFITAALLVFGRFSADQELTAARAGGISLLSLISPVIILSLLCCALSAWFNMDIGPRSRVAYVNLRNELKGELVSAQIPEDRVISDFPGYLFYTAKNRGGKLENVQIFKFEPGTNYSTEVTAPTGEIESDLATKKMTVTLFDARIIREYPHMVSSSVAKYPFVFDLNINSNQVYKPKISDMTFGQLQDEMNRLETLHVPVVATNQAQLREQLGAIRTERRDWTEVVRVEMNRQIAFSFACFGFTLVGIPLSIRVHRRETNIGITMALLLVLVYYSFVLLGQSLSGRPDLAPHLILWLPNLVFQAVGVVLLWRANRG